MRVPAITIFLFFILTPFSYAEDYIYKFTKHKFISSKSNEEVLKLKPHQKERLKAKQQNYDDFSLKLSTDFKQDKKKYFVSIAFDSPKNLMALNSTSLPWDKKITKIHNGELYQSKIGYKTSSKKNYVYNMEISNEEDDFLGSKLKTVTITKNKKVIDSKILMESYPIFDLPSLMLNYGFNAPDKKSISPNIYLIENFSFLHKDYKISTYIYTCQYHEQKEVNINGKNYDCRIYRFLNKNNQKLSFQITSGRIKENFVPLQLKFGIEIKPTMFGIDLKSDMHKNAFTLILQNI